MDGWYITWNAYIEDSEIEALFNDESYYGGILIGTNRMKKSIEEGCVGDLRIDRSIEDEPPRPCLEVYRGNTVDSISQKKFVILKVVNENYLSSN